MATSAATANALTGPPADIHEDDFPMLRALAQLQELHDQSDPHNLFSQLGRVAKEGVEEIEEFKGSWHTPEMEKLWERGRDMSSFSGGQGNDVWDVDYKSLIGKKASVTTLQLKGMEGQDTITAGEKSPRSGEPMDTGLKQDEVDRESEDEDVAQIIEEAKSTYPSLKTNVETPDIISLRVAGMKFKVIRRQEEQPGHPNLSSAWEIQEANPSPGTKSTSSVQQEIIKYINQPNTNKTNHQNKTLQYLLLWDIDMR
ncbi:hypothetical protein UCRPC4_g06427 [Phaeomoniella chlamydospora]|uniref:Uncharacterized protein n=1 Tax=Phaeomoniella chlamydospora TaxID=158046 RepID=A0A0G2GDQ9_PHACM|nr:hypothetical protein UCRPC4_g06427 [Phaeomoniella chlamydospora]